MRKPYGSLAERVELGEERLLVLLEPLDDRVEHEGTRERRIREEELAHVNEPIRILRDGLLAVRRTDQDVALVEQIEAEVGGRDHAPCPIVIDERVAADGARGQLALEPVPHREEERRGRIVLGFELDEHGGHCAQVEVKLVGFLHGNSL